MKKSIAFIFAALLAAGAWAHQYETTVDGVTWYYNIKNGKAEISYRGSYYNSYSNRYSGSLVIPSTLGGYKVTTVGSRAFYNCSSLTSVTIPDSVTTIGANAFDGCSSLTSVTIPDSVTTIGSYAFSGCSSLKEVHITDLAKWCAISFGSFDANPCYYAHHLYQNGEEIRDLVISDIVTTIGAHAFRNCSSLTSITIPDSVTTIGEDAFQHCSSLASITIPDSVTTIGSSAFSWCSSLTSVTIPDSVTTIGDYAFRNCSSLTSITIPDSVTTIGSNAFYGCSSLTSVTIPDRVTTIGSDAFRDCSSLTSVTIPDSVTTIGERAFYGCSKLASVAIGNGVTTIGYGAFDGCSSLTSIDVSDNNETFSSVDGIVYSNDKRTLIFCPEGKMSVTIPNSVTTIGEWAFGGCLLLTSVTIPDSVTTIGEDAFIWCSSLTSVTIPDGVTMIGDSAFYGTPFYDNQPDGLVILGRVLYKCKGICPSSVTIPDGVTTIGEYAFDGCSSLASVTIPDSVTTIGEYAFSSCSSLTSVTIGNGVTMIGDYAFSWCELLASITIPDSVVSIGEYAFERCSALESMLVPASVTSIGQNAFSECEKLNVTFECDCPENYLDTGIFDVASVKSKGKGYPTLQDVIYKLEYHLWIATDAFALFDPTTQEYTYFYNTYFECQKYDDYGNTYYGLPKWMKIVGADNGNFNDDEITWYYDSYVSIITKRYLGESVCLRSNLFEGSSETSYGFFEWGEKASSDSGLQGGEFIEVVSEDFADGYIGPFNYQLRPRLSYDGKVLYKLPTREEINQYITYLSPYQSWYFEVFAYPYGYRTFYVAPERESFVAKFTIYGYAADDKCACSESNPLLQRVPLKLQDPLHESWHSIALYNVDCEGEMYLWEDGVEAKAYEYSAGWNINDGYVCVGWKLVSGQVQDDNGNYLEIGQVVDTVSGFGISSDAEFQAVYAPNSYTITYENYPEGLGYDLPTSYTYNEDCPLPEIADYSFGSELPDGTKTSTFRFEGWTINGEKVDKIPAGTIGDVVVKFNSTLLVNFGDTEGPQSMPGFSHDTTVAWKGAAPTPKVMVTVEGRGELVEGLDFTVEYVDNDKVGTAKVIVRGKGDYIGTYTGSFTITKGSIVAEDARKDIFAWSPDNAVFAYDGTEKSIATIIAEDVDEVKVEVTGTTNAVNAGVYTAKAKGTIKRFASDDYYNYTYVTTVDSTKTLTIKPRDLSGFAAALSQDVFFYDGAAKYPSVSITDEGLGVELKNDKDYNVSYLNNAQIGEASLTITGCGNYKGIITRQFTILDRLENLPKISITPESKVVNGRATITMTYSGIAGYETEVRYTTDGSEPTKDSSKYEKRFAYVVSADTTIKAAAFLRGVRVSEVASVRYLPSVNAAIVQTGEGCGPVEVQTSGAAPWVLDVEELGVDGTPSMKSGKIGNNGESIMTATFEGDGVFEFWWKTSCEYDELEEFFCDHVECWLDDEVYTQADGETPWTKVVVSVTTKGSHTITWKYVKDDADDAEYPGEDCAWVDGVKFSFAAYVDFAADEEIVGTLPERIVSSAGYEIELPELCEVTYEKHVFAGWKYGDKIYLPGEKLTVDAQDMVVKPIWTEVLEVSYDLNGGNGNVPVTQQVVTGGSVNLAGIGEASLAKHSFGGWSLNGNVYAVGTGFVPQSDVQFTAVWIAKTLNMPIISVATEHDEPTTVVEITAIDYEVTIYYTIDGSDPSEENGMRYEGAFEVEGSVTIKAIAIKEDYFDSEVVEATVVSTYTPMSVDFVGGEGVVGTMPSAIETALRREIELPEIGEARLPKHSFAGWTDGTQIYQPGDKYSIVGEVSFAAVWTEKILSSPKIEVAEWYDTEKTEVVITCDNEDAVIYYTIDGTEPSSSNLKYEDGFEVEGSLTIKAIAIAEDWFDSEIVEKGTTRAPWTINEILNSALEFSTGGDSAWKRDLVDGDYMMRSGEIDDDEISWFKVKIPGAGKLAFEWKVSCESFFNKNKEYAADEAIFQAGDTEIEIFGDKPWAKVEVDVTEGEAIWSYRKDESDSSGEDCVWIRNIVWTSAGEQPTRPEAIEGASEQTKAAFDQWILTYEVKNPSEANVNAFILELAPTATDEEIKQKVEAELENLDFSKLAEGDLSAAVEAIQAKYPNAKVALEEVTTIETNAHLYKLVIDLK